MLVSPRNPLNIGAVARAMANFGFGSLAVAAPFEPNWREAKSAVGAPDLLANARLHATLAEALANCTFVAGTGTLIHRKPDQRVIALPDLGAMIKEATANGGRSAIVLGPENHGLSRDDLSWCNVLVEIPTDERQPSMNLGQAAAVCLYELARPEANAGLGEAPELTGAADSELLDRLAWVVEQAMVAADYSPALMQEANRHDLRVMLRRLRLSQFDVRRTMGLFRRILHKLRRA